ncbi:MAG: hypothetical protein IKC08_01390 [Lentisphaeria bacterium]|nr:hypothetical protein [Lentisphaeria bacterium]
MKKILEEVKDAVIYQINLRVFTKEGTFAAAEKFLPDVAATGADIIYLCSIAQSDEENDPSSWSMRQKRSLTGNPRNPYRLNNYFAIDEEYGGDEGLRSFVKKAHSLNLKVMLDLVYGHSGPTFGKDHPSYVKRDEKGNIQINNYNFCSLDFSSPELREYLWYNMEYFVKEFDVDGYRCDVGASVPLDFWVEGRRRVEKIKKPFIMLDECEIQSRKEDQDEAFDINYCQWWTQHCFPAIFQSGMPAVSLQIAYEEADNARPGAVLIRAIEHHDTANDMYYARVEKISSEKCEACYVLCYTVPGVPFLYNGCEYSDTSRHSIFGKKGDFTIDRSKNPEKRTSFLARLAELHRKEEALRNGKMLFLDNPAKDSLCTYVRTAPNGEKIFCAINLGNEKVTACCDFLPEFSSGKVLLERGTQVNGKTLDIKENGFIVIKRESV